MPGHQLIRVHPAGKRAYALQPGVDTRVIRPADAELIWPVEIAAQGQIGNGRSVADGEASILQVRIQDAQRGLHAPAQEVVHLRLADFRQVHHVAQRGNVAGELVVLPAHPPQDLASLVVVAAGEFAEVGGKVMQDHARLAEALAAMLEHRHLAHFVDRAVLGRAGLAAEEIHPPRLPLRSAQVEHQRDLERVTRLGEAVKLEFCHQWLSRGTKAPLLPTRKSRSAPSLACSTWSKYSFQYPRSSGAGGSFHFFLRSRRTSSVTSSASLRFSTSSSIMSPFSTRASAPPASASGQTCSTTVP